MKIDNTFEFELPTGWVYGWLSDDLLICYPQGEDSELAHVQIDILTGSEGPSGDTPEKFIERLGVGCIDLDQKLDLSGTAARRIAFHIPADPNAPGEHFQGSVQYLSDGKRAYRMLFQTTPTEHKRFANSGGRLLDSARRSIH